MAGDAITLEKDGVIQVTWTGADNDWNYIVDTPAYAKLGYYCSSITFHGSAVNDILIVNEGGDDGPSRVHWQLSAATDDRVKYFNPSRWIRPYIDYSDCDFDTYGDVKVVFEIV